MAICNRDLDQSEKVQAIEYTQLAVATGATVVVGLVASPARLHKIAVAAYGVSTTPTYNLEVHRWTSAGLTVIAPGSAVTLAANFGVSGGAVSATFNSGSSLAQLQAGDLLVVKSGGANSAAAILTLAIVLEATQDIKKTFDVP